MVRASACARSLSPPPSSPIMMFTLRVKSTVPSASSSPLVSASAPSTRSRPKACTRISFFSGPFWTDRATPRIANSKSAMAVCALQRLGDVLHEAAVLRDGLRRVTLQYPPITGDEELLEVPADVARNAGARPGEEAVDRVAAGPVYLELAAQGEAHVVGAAAEGGDFRFAPRLLRGELIAGEADHGEVLVPQLPLQLLEDRILRSQTAAAGHVHGQRHLAAQRSQQVVGAVDPRDGNVVEAAHGSALPGDRCVHVPYTSGRLNIATFVRRALAETLMASELDTAETPKVVAILNRILELELAGL